MDIFDPLELIVAIIGIGACVLGYIASTGHFFAL